MNTKKLRLHGHLTEDELLFVRNIRDKYRSVLIGAFIQEHRDLIIKANKAFVYELRNEDKFTCYFYLENDIREIVKVLSEECTISLSSVLRTAIYALMNNEAIYNELQQRFVPRYNAVRRRPRSNKPKRDSATSA